MRITITGPRSVGKTTTAILLAERLGYRYVSSDELMDDMLKPYGGLAKVLHDKRMDILAIYTLTVCRHALDDDNVVFDLAGGALTQQEKDAGKQVKHYIRTHATVIGLLPSMDDDIALKQLFERERERPHFKRLSDDALKEKVARNYKDVKWAIKEVTDRIVYTALLTADKVVGRCELLIK